MNVRDFLAVFVGGGLGSVLRYVTGLAFLQRLGPGFPYGTLFINVVGCFAIGVVAELLQSRALAASSTVRLFFTAGMLGGFTTFSTFAYESVTIGGEGAPAIAAAYVLASVAGGLLAAFAGMLVVRAAA
jgi:CrcB protein